MSRPGIWIRPPAPKSWRLFDELHERGNTIILVTHESDIAKHAHRVIRLLDGKIASDEITCNNNRKTADRTLIKCQITLTYADNRRRAPKTYI